MSAADPAIRARIARLGAYSQHAKYPASETTTAARAAVARNLNARLTAQWSLDETAPDYPQRLQSARHAYYQALSLKGSKARAAASRRVGAQQ